MHVLQLGPYPPPEGGINRNMLAIRADLWSMAHRCSVVATTRSTAVTNEPDVYHPRSAYQLIRRLFSIPHDLLHLHVGGRITARNLALIFISSLFARGQNILSFHSGEYPHTKAGRRARRWSVRGFVFRRFAKIIAVNEPIAEVFRRYGVPGDDVHVIPAFVPRVPDDSVAVPEHMREFTKKSMPFLLTVGLLEHEYDLFMQIDAMSGILARFPSAGLMIVGSGSLHDRLKRAIAAKSYRDHVFLAGDVDHAVTLHLIREADALLRTTFYDGDAISVREALFLGTRVIATDNGMRPAGVRLIKMGDKTELVKAVAELADAAKPSPNTTTQEDRANSLAVIELYSELMRTAAPKKSRAMPRRKPANETF